MKQNIKNNIKRGFNIFKKILSVFTIITLA